jgi:hypothetical protein
MEPIINLTGMWRVTRSRPRQSVLFRPNIAREAPGIMLVGAGRAGRAVQVTVNGQRDEAGVGPGEFVGESGGAAERG